MFYLILLNYSRVTVMSWGDDHVEHYKKSGLPVFERLADLMVVGGDAIGSIRLALKR